MTGPLINPKREDGLHLQEIEWDQMVAMYMRAPVPYGIPTYYAIDRHGRCMVFPRTCTLELK